jgi:hypothetical protein
MQSINSEIFSINLFHFYDFLDFIEEQVKNIDKNPTSTAFRLKQSYFDPKQIKHIEALAALTENPENWVAICATYNKSYGIYPAIEAVGSVRNLPDITQKPV